MFAIISMLALAAASPRAPPRPLHSSHRSPASGSIEGLFKGSDYPPEALDKNEQGNVGVLIKIDPAGAISDCIIDKSSAVAALDARTCEVIRARAKFKPALDAHGRPVASELRQTITWRIADSMMASDPWTSRVVIDFGPDGKAKSCRIELTGAMQPPPGEAPPACMPSELDRDVSGETRLGGAIDRTIVEQQFALGPTASPAPAGAGEMIAGRNVLKLDIDATGKLSGCKVIDKIGIAAVADPCLKISKQYEPRRGHDGEPAPFEATMTVTTLVHLDGKRMPLTGSHQGLIRSEDYPPEALDRNEQGSVTMRLRVDPTGAVSDCTIDQSSGFAVLDKKTCELMRQRAHFDPARDREGKAVASETSGRVSWKIADDSMPSDPWVVRTIIVFDPVGRKASCRTEFEGALQSNPGAAGDPCSDGAAPLPSKVRLGAPGAVTTIAVEERFGSVDSPTPPLQAGDMLIARQVLRLDIDAQGKVASCKVLDRKGAGPDDPCADFDQEFTPRKDANGRTVPFEGKQTMTISVHVEKVT